MQGGPRKAASTIPVLCLEELLHKSTTDGKGRSLEQHIVFQGWLKRKSKSRRRHTGYTRSLISAPYGDWSRATTHRLGRLFAVRWDQAAWKAKETRSMEEHGFTSPTTLQ